MALGRSETNFKGPRTLSNQFSRFFVKKCVTDHFVWTLKNNFFHENWIINSEIEIFMKKRVFKCPDKVFGHKIRKRSWTLEICF